MFTKKSLISIIVIALLVAVGYPAKADFAAEGLDQKWYDDDNKSGDSDLLDNAYKTVADTWQGLSDFAGNLLGSATDTFESLPSMESPEPKQQTEYRYVPRHTTGYPKWIRVPAE